VTNEAAVRPADQADDAEGEHSGGIHVAGIAHSTQRQDDHTDAEERRRHAQLAVDGNKRADEGGTGAASY